MLRDIADQDCQNIFHNSSCLIIAKSEWRKSMYDESCRELTILVLIGGWTSKDWLRKSILGTRVPCGNSMAKVHISIPTESEPVRQQPQHERIQLQVVPTYAAIDSSAMLMSHDSPPWRAVRSLFLTTQARSCDDADLSTKLYIYFHLLLSKYFL